MCIRDRYRDVATSGRTHAKDTKGAKNAKMHFVTPARTSTCLLYTSDAADERSSVDLGGRRIIKKKKKEKTVVRWSIEKKTNMTEQLNETNTENVAKKKST